MDCVKNEELSFAELSSLYFLARVCDSAAIEQLASLSAQNVLLAKGFFAIILYYGIGMDEDVDQAKQLMSGCFEPLNQGCTDPTFAPYAHYILAVCYKFGLGIPPSADMRFMHLKASAMLNYPPALNALASSMMDGSDGIPQNQPEAYRMIKAAVDQDYAEAFSTMGLMYQQGTCGVTINLQTAFNWYQQAAERGVPEGQYNLANMLMYGFEGQPANEVRAFELFMKAAKQKYHDAQEAVAYCYMRGIVVPRCCELSLSWYTLSAKQDNLLAIQTLAALYLCGNQEIDIDEAQAIHWFEQALRIHRLNGDLTILLADSENDNMKLLRVAVKQRHVDLTRHCLEHTNNFSTFEELSSYDDYRFCLMNMAEMGLNMFLMTAFPFDLIDELDAFVYSGQKNDFGRINVVTISSCRSTFRYLCSSAVMENEESAKDKLSDIVTRLTLCTIEDLPIQEELLEALTESRIV